MVADSNSQIAWHRAQIKKHRETLKHLETGRFRFGQIAGARSAGQMEKTVAELQAKISESERIVATTQIAASGAWQSSRPRLRKASAWSHGQANSSSN